MQKWVQGISTCHVSLCLLACTQVFSPTFFIIFFEWGLSSPPYACFAYDQSPKKRQAIVIYFCFPSFLFVCMCMCDGKKQKQHPMHLVYAQPSPLFTLTRRTCWWDLFWSCILFFDSLHTAGMFFDVFFFSETSRRTNRLVIVWF